MAARGYASDLFARRSLANLNEVCDGKAEPAEPYRPPSGKAAITFRFLFNDAQLKLVLYTSKLEYSFADTGQVARLTFHGRSHPNSDRPRDPLHTHHSYRSWNLVDPGLDFWCAERKQAARRERALKQPDVWPSRRKRARGWSSAPVKRTVPTSLFELRPCTHCPVEVLRSVRRAPPDTGPGGTASRIGNHAASIGAPAQVRRDAGNGFSRNPGQDCQRARTLIVSQRPSGSRQTGFAAHS